MNRMISGLFLFLVGVMGTATCSFSQIECVASYGGAIRDAVIYEMPKAGKTYAYVAQGASVVENYLLQFDEKGRFDVLSQIEIDHMAVKDRIMMNGNVLVLPTEEGLQIVDITEPRHPINTAILSHSAESFMILLEGGILHVNDGSKEGDECGWYVHSFLMPEYQIYGDCLLDQSDLWLLQDTHTFFGRGDSAKRLYLFDLSEPSNPKQMGSIPFGIFQLPWYFQMALLNGDVFLPSGMEGIYMLRGILPSFK